MTPVERLEKLKYLIDEEGYPMFSDEILNNLLFDRDIYSVAKELVLRKSKIPEIKLGDVTIKSPSEYFMGLFRSYSALSEDDEGDSSSKVRIARRYDGT